MGTVLVCLPTPAVGWQQVCATSPIEAFAATDALRESFGLGPRDDEDAEHAAMVVASVAALVRFGVRHVITAEVDQDTIDPDLGHPDAGNGRVLLTPAALASSDDPWGRLTAWFTDDVGVDVTAAAAAVTGCSLDDAWQNPLVAELVAHHALLWHSVTEPTAREGC